MAVIFDLRPDASLAYIRAAVDAMQLGWLNARITRWTFQHMLLRRAWSEENFRQMAAESPFQTCQCDRGPISLEVSLHK